MRCCCRRCCACDALHVMLLLVADASPCYLLPCAQVWVGMDKEVGGCQQGVTTLCIQVWVCSPRMTARPQ